MKGRWVFVVALAALAAAVPLATAGAQTPTTEAPATVEGSIPPGGTVNCEAAPTLDPPNGPPGTLVTVSAEFFGNCDQFFITDFTSSCIGQVTGEGLEGFSFPMEPFPSEVGPDLVGTFTAPVTEPNPPVQDAIEPLTVTVTCEVTTGGSQLSGTEGPGTTTTYVYPAATFSLELFADPDGDQPTFVDNDPDVVDVPGVIDATPTFTG